MLVIDGTFAGLRRVRLKASRRVIEVEHAHPHDHDELGHAAPRAHDHAHVGAEIEARVGQPVSAGPPTRRPHRHRGSSHAHAHRHELTLPVEATARYGRGTATGIGMLHGIGIESPTQIAVFVAATSATGLGFGLALLGTWVVGLIAANAALAFLAGGGLLQAERSFPVYATLAVLVSCMSIGLGTLYLTGLDVLPGILV